jgi:hypothetical protein
MYIDNDKSSRETTFLHPKKDYISDYMYKCMKEAHDFLREGIVSIHHIYYL